MYNINALWLSATSIIKLVYTYIFPEYTNAGVWLVCLALFLFVVYLFKSVPGQAAKISAAVLVVLSFILLVLHHLAKILHLSLSF
jgi:uncharacterized membrane protein YfhO